MKLIFLDIDGPLATWESYKHEAEIKEPGVLIEPEVYRYYPFDVKAVNNLNIITRETGAKIVISSTWRKLYPTNILKKMFKIEGVEAEIVGETPVRLSSRDRGVEILEYLKDCPADTQYVIIDDDRKDIVDYCPGRLVWIEQGMAMGGIHYGHVKQALQILNGELQ